MSNPSRYTAELDTALRAVHLASLLTKSHLLNHLSSKTSTPGSGSVSASTKSDDSEVTTADFASQAVIISVLHHVFPDDVFIAEESGEMLRGDGEEARRLRGRVWELVGTVREVQGKYTRDEEEMVDVKLPGSMDEMIDLIDLGQHGGHSKTSGTDLARRTWILDPIDGTKTYIRGQQYVVCLCLVEHGEQQVAVFGCPSLSIEERDAQGRVRIEEGLVDLRGDGGWIVSCVKGSGVELARMKSPMERRGLDEVIGWGGNEVEQVDGVSDGDDESSAPILLSFTDSAASPHTSKDLHRKIFQHFASPSAPSPVIPLDIWSMQLKYVLLTLRASGADAMIRTPPTSAYHASVWDHAGGQLLLRESEGVLTDAEGVEFLLDGSMRKLEQNWGVCGIRGGTFKGRNGKGMSEKEVHGFLLACVTRMVKERDEARR